MCLLHPEHIQGMLNVGFTRARDEMHIFYSAEICDFGMVSGAGAIKEWLEYCSRCTAISRPLGDSEGQLAKAQSQFEQQVMTALLSKGVKVTAQYPSCGYFIDIVAELNDNRLAIECDGEIWHLDEHGELKMEDVVRQEVLERAGWKVARIPYRSWLENPELQLQRIVNELCTTAEPKQVPVRVPASPAIGHAEPTAVDRFESAIINALKSGLRSHDDIFRSARELLGYSRLGPQIRIALSDGLERLVQRGILRIEEDEAFFSNDQVRNAIYVVKITAAPLTRPRRRHYRRYRRW